MQCKIITAFRYSPDGVTSTALSPGRIYDLKAEFVDGLIADGFVELVDSVQVVRDLPDPGAGMAVDREAASAPSKPIRQRKPRQ